MRQEHDKGLHTKDTPMLIDSLNHSMSLWLNKMSGARNELATAIRTTAENCFEQGRPMRVLDVTEGLPFKGLEIRGRGFRQNGDMLTAGFNGPHPRPEIHTTIVSSRDLTGALLEGRLDVESQAETHAYNSIIMPALNLAGYIPEQNIGQGRSAVLPYYNSLKFKGNIDVVTDNEPIHLLERLKTAGKRFDLAFLDPKSVKDKLSYFQVVQSCLSDAGVAYIPIEWWTVKPPSQGEGKEQVRLWRETKVSERGAEDLEDYLAREYPTAFAIAPFPGAKTLIIKGTKEPVSF